MPIGPGVICDMATISVNICSLTHPGPTISLSMSASMAYPPPKPNRPIFRYAHINLRYIIIIFPPLLSIHYLLHEAFSGGARATAIPANRPTLYI